MSLSPITDYAQAVACAKENPCHTIRFEGKLPCGSLAKQDITHADTQSSLNPFIEASTGKFVVVHGKDGLTLYDTQEQDNVPCTPGWIKAGNSLREPRRA